MSKPGRPAEGQRQQLLAKLRVFEKAAEEIHPEKQGVDTSAHIARYQNAAEDLRMHLSQHLASKETVDWPELPDSAAEISTYAGELKAEHQQLLNGLEELLRDAGKLEEALDRADAAARLRSQSRSLALRIARHAGEEEAPLGKFL